MTSIQEWERQAARSTALSRSRRLIAKGASPQPWPERAREWLIVLAITVVTVMIGYLFLVFFGVTAWA